MQASKARTSFDPFYPIAWNKPTRTSKEEVKYWNYLVVQSILQLNEKALDSDRRTISINSLVVQSILYLYSCRTCARMGIRSGWWKQRYGS